MKPGQPVKDASHLYEVERRAQEEYERRSREEEEVRKREEATQWAEAQRRNAPQKTSTLHLLSPKYNTVS